MLCYEVWMLKRDGLYIASSSPGSTSSIRTVHEKAQRKCIHIRTLRPLLFVSSTPEPLSSSVYTLGASNASTSSSSQFSSAISSNKRMTYQE